MPHNSALRQCCGPMPAVKDLVYVGAISDVCGVDLGWSNFTLVEDYFFGFNLAHLFFSNISTMSLYPQQQARDKAVVSPQESLPRKFTFAPYSSKISTKSALLQKVVPPPLASINGEETWYAPVAQILASAPRSSSFRTKSLSP
eukprot:GEMP01013643.1.p2 GENE.GEMP01013643.1~~GEMP01013643.1.p2  ORF type:complete len:144 (-),score=26.14 GEMP01013643.1:432-863(-)